MKKIGLILVSIFAIISLVNAQETNIEKQNKTKKTAEITFEKNLHDFGTIPNEGNGTYEFKFKNTGKSPLSITNVQTSCGCTTPDYSKEPVLKGKTGIIKVSYDTKRIGNFIKTITVTSNAKNAVEVLTIKGNVLEKQ
jgi:hypothetical protein